MSRSAMAGVRMSANSSLIITGSVQDEERKSHARLENTYRMEPSKHFPEDVTKTIIKDVLENAFEGKKYNNDEANKLCGELANKIKLRVKGNVPQRYKIVTFVVVGEERLATVKLSSQCVWNAKFDTYTEYAYRNGSIYAVGMVYGVYVE